MIKRFKAKRDFSIPEFDKDGFLIGETVALKKGEIFEMDTGKQRMMCGFKDDAVRLTNGNRWIEITKKALGEMFEEVKKDD